MSVENIERVNDHSARFDDYDDGMEVPISTVHCRDAARAPHEAE